MAHRRDAPGRPPRFIRVAQGSSDARRQMSDADARRRTPCSRTPRARSHSGHPKNHHGGREHARVHDAIPLTSLDTQRNAAHGTQRTTHKATRATRRTTRNTRNATHATQHIRIHSRHVEQSPKPATMSRRTQRNAGRKHRVVCVGVIGPSRSFPLLHSVQRGASIRRSPAGKPLDFQCDDSRVFHLVEQHMKGEALCQAFPHVVDLPFRASYRS